MVYNVQILRLLVRGYDMAATAVELGKSESAIKDARKTILPSSPPGCAVWCSTC